MSILGIIFIVAWITACIIFAVYIIYNKILCKYTLITSQDSFQELIVALNIAVQTELDLWEKDVFNDKNAITNSNFENYYHEITDHILKSLSPIFFKKMSQYVTEDAIISIIARKTKEYLVSKINGTV